MAPGSAFADVVLLLVSELLVNVLRHGPRPRPVADLGSHAFPPWGPV